MKVVYVSLSEPSVGVPVLAFVTTWHLAMAALRNHRRPGPHAISSLAIVSVVFGATPWLFPSIAGIAGGLATHAIWFAVCERWGVMGSSAAKEASVAAKASAPRQTVLPAVPRPSIPPRPKGFVQVSVLAVLDETADIRTFRLARPEGFQFQAGQFLTVRMRADGQEHVRCYSISSPPEASGYLDISVKRQGLVSNALHATIHAGSLITVRAPAGAFTYPADDDRPVLLLAAGVGITPLMSMLRHGVLAEPGRPMTLLYSARTQADLAFRDEIEWLVRRSPRLRVTFATSGGPARPDMYPGRIDAGLLRTVPDVEHAIALVCGPQAMIQTMTTLLGELGVERPQVRFEVFEAAVAASSRSRPTLGDRLQGNASCATFSVKAARSGRELTIATGQTLLDAAEQQGLEIPSICRAGVCGTCRTRVLEGNVECTSDLIEEDDRRAGYVLACVSSARSDCVIEA